uniref:Uncharacterized protein n=1 Tax=Strongyloides stercoralis TaxID=6248 RepID=A0AAF5DBY2_STRER
MKNSSVTDKKLEKLRFLRNYFYESTNVQEQEIIAFKNKLQTLNNINYHNVPDNTINSTSELIKINAPIQNFSDQIITTENIRNNSLYGNDFSIIEDSNRHPFIRSGISEDSDYTSDVSFPINHHQQNSSTNHWNNQLHPPNGYIQRDAGRYKEENYYMDINNQEMQNISGYNSQFNSKQLNDHNTHEENIYYTNNHSNSEIYNDQYNTLNDEDIRINKSYNYDEVNKSSNYYNSMSKYLDDNEYIKDSIEISHPSNEDYYISNDKNMINDITCYQNYYPMYQENDNHQVNVPHLNTENSTNNYNYQNTYYTQYDEKQCNFEKDLSNTHEYNNEVYDDYKVDTPNSSRTIYESDRTNIPYLPSSATASDSDNKGVPLIRQTSNRQQRRDTFKKDSSQIQIPLDDELINIKMNKNTNYYDESNNCYYQSNHDVDVYHQDDYETVSDTTIKHDWKNDNGSLIIDNTEPLSYNSRSITYNNKKIPEYYVEYDTVPTVDSSNDEFNQYYSNNEENEHDKDNCIKENSPEKVLMSEEDLKKEKENIARKNMYKELWKKAYCEVCKQVGLKLIISVGD